MLASALALSLLGLAVASPVYPVATPPPKSQSKGFNLVVHVTDKTHDFKPSIENQLVNSIHVGAGLALAGIGSKSNNPSIFYQNGTIEEARYGQSDVLTDQGLPPAPYGISLVKDQGSQILSTVHIDGGAGTKGVGISRFPEQFAFLVPETYVVCNESLAYYQGTYFLIIKQAETTVDSNGNVNKNLPAGCAPVRLVPQCAKLPDLPAGSIASHALALDSDCYKDVSSIKW